MRNLYRTIFLAPLLLSGLSLLPAPAAASSGAPTHSVRGYFDALTRGDFNRALSLTANAARQHTRAILDTLRQEADRNGCKLSLEVRSLRVLPGPAARYSGVLVPVDVSFEIAVIAKKWFTKRIARILAGTARFYVSAFGQPQIVNIVGALGHSG